jgi:hypothetical protein
MARQQISDSLLIDETNWKKLAEALVVLSTIKYKEVLVDLKRIAFVNISATYT